MYGVCWSVTPLCVVRKNRLLPWSVLVSRLSVIPLSQSSRSVPADNFMSVCHTGQCRPGHCKMMSHQSVSSWSVPDDVTPVSVVLVSARWCHTGQCRPGQCQMMSHQSVSSWSVPDDVTPVSVVLVSARWCQTGLYRPAVGFMSAASLVSANSSCARYKFPAVDEFLLRSNQNSKILICTLTPPAPLPTKETDGAVSSYYCRKNV